MLRPILAMRVEVRHEQVEPDLGGIDGRLEALLGLMHPGAASG
jgi:hypothetical protein